MAAWRSVRETVEPVTLFVALLVVWEVGVRAADVPTIILPGPIDVFGSLWFNHLVLLDSLFTSLQFIVYGFVVGSLLGILLAIGVTYSTILERALYPVLILSFVTPKIVIAPIVVIWVGAGPVYYTFVPMLLVFFPVLENTATGLKGIDQELKDLNRIYRTSRWFTFRSVYLPSSLPYVLAGLKIGITQATIGVIIAEIIAPEQGIGEVLQIGVTFLRTKVTMAAIVLIGIMGIVLFKTVEFIEDRLIFWEDVEASLA